MGSFFRNEKNNERGAVQLILVVAVLGGLLVAFILGKSIAEEDLFRLLLIGGTLGGLSILLIMGKKYWYLLILAYPLGNTPLNIGAKEILLQELVTPLVFVWFLANIALRRQQFTVIRKESTFILLFCIWAGVVMYLNPVGISLFGASTGGFRFYSHIGMALCSYLVLSNQKISNKDCFWIIFFVILASFISLAQQILFFWMYGGVLGTDGEAYTWHQALAGPAMAITIYIVARYRWSQILSIPKWYLSAILLACVAISFFSGKRTGAASILLIPLVSAFMRKEYAHAILMLAASLLVIAMLVLGQHTLFTLPYNVQRSLANLPGDWDPEITNLTTENTDTFRGRLWEFAYEKIRKDPFIGTGFRVSDAELQTTAAMRMNDDQKQIEELAIGSSWHSLWIGIAADFGIPAAIIFALFVIQSIILAGKLFNKKDLEQTQQIVVKMFFLYFIMFLITSYTGGHTARTPMGLWWMYGVLVGLKYTFPKLTSAKKDKIALDAESAFLPAASKA
ncbi:MAG: O-antigen ligase family protein [Chthoniobacterales bacterium]